MKTKEDIRNDDRVKSKRYYDRHRKEILQKKKLTGANKGKYDPIKQRGYVKKYSTRIKLEVFNHYSDNQLCCKCCKIDIFDFLTIDHVGGRQLWDHKREMGGSKLYQWLRGNNYPEGFEVLCFNCNWGRYKNNGKCPHAP
jgi:hypothetical protein